MADEKVKDADKPVLDVPPASRVDLEERLERDHRAVSSVAGPLDDDGKLRAEVNAPFAVEGNDTSAYVGVSPEYMTYADDTSKPFDFEGVEGDSVDQMLGEQFAVGADPEVEVEHGLGSGSNVETVYTHTSGENYVPEVVDREKLKKDAEKAEEKEAAAASKAAAPAPAPRTQTAPKNN